MAGASRTPGALFCDTNVLVRLLTGDPAPQARAAERALERADAQDSSVIVPDIVVAELAYVLTEVYGLTPAQAAARIADVLSLPGVEVADRALLEETLAIWRDRALDFADAYLAALAGTTIGTAVLSFDRDLDRIPGVRRVDPSNFPAG